MTKKEFQDLTGQSRGQTDRLCKKGRFHVAGFGWFVAAKKGKAKTAPIDIQAEAKLKKQAPDTGGGSVPSTPSAPVVPSVPVDLPPGYDPPETLKDLHVLMQIKKLQQGLEEGKKSIRKEYRAELVEVLARVLAPLHEAFTQMNLTADQIATLTDALNSALQELEDL